MSDVLFAERTIGFDPFGTMSKMEGEIPLANPPAAMSEDADTSNDEDTILRWAQACDVVAGPFYRTLHQTLYQHNTEGTAVCVEPKISRILGSPEKAVDLQSQAIRNWSLLNQIILKSSRLHHFSFILEPIEESRESVFEERNRVLDALDAIEEGHEDPSLMAELQRLNTKIDDFRQKDYESGQQEPPIHLIESLSATNEELLKVFSRIMNRLKGLDGKGDKAT